MDAVMANNGNENRAKQNMKDILDRAYEGNFHDQHTRATTACNEKFIRFDHDHDEETGAIEDDVDPADSLSVTTWGKAEVDGELLTDDDYVAIENLGDYDQHLLGRVKVRTEDIPDLIDALEEFDDRLND